MVTGTESSSHIKGNFRQNFRRASFLIAPAEWSGDAGIRTKTELLAAIREFFKDNPAWE
jgi:hypothetical protein